MDHLNAPLKGLEDTFGVYMCAFPNQEKYVDANYALGEAEIGYLHHKTSLPTMLLFEDDLQARQQTTALFLEGQTLLGLGRLARARQCLKGVLKRDPNHAQAADMLDELTDR